MKFILVIKICSALFMNCQAPFQHPQEYNSWLECANAGYLNAVEINNKLGSNFVNTNIPYTTIISDKTLATTGLLILKSVIYIWLI